MNEFRLALQAHPRKRVPLDDLRRHYFSLYPEAQNSPERGALLLEALRALSVQGAIALPAAASWERAGAPPLPLWVTLVRELPSTASQDHTDVTWCPELGFWPQLRRSQLDVLRSINDFLLRRRGDFMQVPIKERSLEIFGDEKRLDALCDGDALFGGQLPLRTIGCFRVPQPLPYRVADAPGKPLLVVENHNTFWSFGEWNQTALQYAAVVFGGGLNFRLTGRALGQAALETRAVGAEYFGDLDLKGVSIPVDFNRTTEPGALQVSAALRLYRWLLSHGARVQKPQCKTFPAGLAAQWLGADLATELEADWAAGLWIPQEAMGTEQLSGHPCF